MDDYVEISNYEHYNNQTQFVEVAGSGGGSNLPSEKFGSKMIGPLFASIIVFSGMISFTVFYCSYRLELRKRRKLEGGFADHEAAY